MKIKPCSGNEYFVGLRFYAKTDDGHYVVKDKDNKYTCNCNSVLDQCRHIEDFMYEEMANEIKSIP